jgi:hypothetical protein
MDICHIWLVMPHTAALDHRQAIAAAVLSERAELAATTPNIAPNIARNITRDSAPDITLEIVTPQTLPEQIKRGDLIYNLTLEALPPTIAFAARDFYALCDRPQTLQDLVQSWGYGIGPAQTWLPVVLTQRGPLYGEMIALGTRSAASRSATASALDAPMGDSLEAWAGDWQFVQPLHHSDRDRQKLYQLAHHLLTQTKAPPGTHLLQVEAKGGEIIFERLWPFPAMPAIGSLRVQKPDLFSTHLRCLVGAAVRDLMIQST